MCKFSIFNVAKKRVAKCLQQLNRLDRRYNTNFSISLHKNRLGGSQVFHHSSRSITENRELEQIARSNNERFHLEIAQRLQSKYTEDMLNARRKRKRARGDVFASDASDAADSSGTDDDDELQRAIDASRALAAAPAPDPTQPQAGPSTSSAATETTETTKTMSFAALLDSTTLPLVLLTFLRGRNMPVRDILRVEMVFLSSTPDDWETRLQDLGISSKDALCVVILWGRYRRATENDTDPDTSGGWKDNNVFQSGAKKTGSKKGKERAP